MAIIQSKVELLKKIKDDHDAINQEINAGMTISLGKLGTMISKRNSSGSIRKAPT